MFHKFNQFKIEHYKEIQEVLKLLPQISSNGHDPKPLIVFQLLNSERDYYGEIEGSKRFDPLCQKEDWYVDRVSAKDILPENMTPAQKFEWKDQLVEKSKGKHSKIKVALKKKTEA